MKSNFEQMESKPSLSIGQIITLHKLQNKSLTAQFNTNNKDPSRVFAPYQALNLHTHQRNLENIKYTKPSSDVLDAVDNLIDELNDYLDKDTKERQNIAEDKYIHGKKSNKSTKLKHSFYENQDSPEKETENDN